MLTIYFLSSKNLKQSSTEPLISNDEQQLEDPSPRKVVKISNLYVKGTISHYLEAFIEKTEHNIFHPKNVNTKMFHNITKKRKRSF